MAIRPSVDYINLIYYLGTLQLRAASNIASHVATALLGKRQKLRIIPKTFIDKNWEPTSPCTSDYSVLDWILILLAHLTTWG